MTSAKRPKVLSPLEKRIAEIRAENALAKKVERRCVCGCRASAPCGHIRISDDGEEYGMCGWIPGHDVCAACLAPDRRMPMGAFLDRLVAGGSR